MWTLPLLIVGLTVALAIPLGLYLAGIFDSRLRARLGCAGARSASTPVRRTGSSTP